MVAVTICSDFGAQDLEPKLTVSIVSPSICHEVMGPDAMISVFLMLTLKPAFSLYSFTFIKRVFSSPSLSSIIMVSSAYLRLLIFLLAVLIAACVRILFPVNGLSRLCFLQKRLPVYDLR